MTTQPLAGRVAIAGAATAGVGWSTEATPVELMAQATRAALADARLRLAQVDAVFAVTPYYWMPSIALADELGIRPRLTDSTNIGGASVVAHVGHALRAIVTGGADVAVIAYASTQRSDTGRLVTRAEVPPYEQPYGAQFPQVAVAASRWASLNPEALRREPLTIDDVIASPAVSDPLRKLDCCLVTNGGGAIVLTAANRRTRKPVKVFGVGESHSHCYASSMRSFTRTDAVESSRAAYDMAGIGPEDIDVVQIYDAFTINVIVGLEDTGFCAKGDGGKLVERGIGPGGALAVNTSGGGLRYCHPGMFGIFLLIEAVRQLRAEAGELQVASARRALVHGYGGIFAGNATVVLGRG